MKQLICVLALFFTSAEAFAAGAKVTVNGMVCAFCAQGIKKKFSTEPVEKVEVDLDKKLVSLEFKPGKTLSDEQIQTAIKEAGYKVVKIEREKK